MKKGIHPNYRPVVFQDTAANFSFLTRSCAETDETIKWTDGKEYPLYKVEISSASHPFFTGKMKLVDTTGRVQKFQDRYKNTKFAAKTEVVLPRAEDEGEAKPAKPAPASKPEAKKDDKKGGGKK